MLETFVQHGRLQRSWQKTSAELLKITGVSRSMVDEWATLDITGPLILSFFEHRINLFLQEMLKIYDQNC